MGTQVDLCEGDTLRGENTSSDHPAQRLIAVEALEKLLVRELFVAILGDVKVRCTVGM